MAADQLQLLSVIRLRRAEFLIAECVPMPNIEVPLLAALRLPASVQSGSRTITASVSPGQSQKIPFGRTVREQHIVQRPEEAAAQLLGMPVAGHGRDDRLPGFARGENVAELELVAISGVSKRYREVGTPVVRALLAEATNIVVLRARSPGI